MGKVQSKPTKPRCTGFDFKVEPATSLWNISLIQGAVNNMDLKKTLHECRFIFLFNTTLLCSKQLLNGCEVMAGVMYLSTVMWHYSLKCNHKLCKLSFSVL